MAYLGVLYAPDSILRDWDSGDTSADFGGWLSDAVSAVGSAAKSVGKGVTSAAKAVGRGASVAAKATGSFASNAARSAGRGASKAYQHIAKKVEPLAKHVRKGGKWLSTAMDDARKAVNSVPIVGGALSAVVGIATSPAKLIGEIASGARLDRAVLGQLKRSVADVREVAPYVQAVVSLVPGVGQGMSGAIGAGLALAEGRPISEAIMVGVRDSLPGGPMVGAVFNAGAAALQGKSLEDIGIAALPVPDQAKKALKAGLEFATKVARGENVVSTLVSGVAGQLPGEAGRALTTAYSVAKNPKEALSTVLRDYGDELPPAAKQAIETGLKVAENPSKGVAVLLDAAAKQLPADAQRGLTMGVALGEAANVQKETLGALAALPASVAKAIGDKGRTLVSRVEVAAKAQAKLPSAEARKGFEIGLGMMQYSGANEAYLASVRRRLRPEERVGFDAGLAFQIGVVETQGKPPAKLVKSPEARAAYYVTRGMRGAPVASKVGIMGELAKAPAARAGAESGVLDVARLRDHEAPEEFMGGRPRSLWTRAMDALAA